MKKTPVPDATRKRPGPALAFVARALATAFGAGYTPKAPGTAGTLVAVPLAWLLADVSHGVYAAIVVAVIGLGIAAAHLADASWGTHDSQRIVIDEVAGYLVTMALVSRHDPVALSVGFVVFRFFDIMKPPPVRWVDRSMPGGPGVVLDDVMAGIYGAGVLWLVMHAAGR